MNGFVFWMSVANSSIDLEALKPHNHTSLSSCNFTFKNINDHTGLSYCNNVVHAPIIVENDTYLIFSPESHFVYKGERGENAAKILLNELSGKGKLDFSAIENRFSIILYNKQNSRIDCAIDKFGIEKIYYSMHGGCILISNILSLLTQMFPDTPTLSDQAIYNYIDSHIIPSPLTIYRNIYKLEPSQCISITDGIADRDIYWKPDFHEESSTDIESLEEQTREILEHAVINCGLTGSTGAFLSGGLDSSTVSGYFAKNRNSQVSTYTMGFDEAGYDETEYARIAARHFGTNLRSYYVTPDDVAGAFSHVIRSYDEPFGNSSAVPAYLCAQFAHNDGITDMLAGDGGDEIFAGNERYTKQHVFEHYQHVPVALRKYILEPLFMNSMPFTRIFPFSKVKSYIEQANTAMPDRMERYNFINQFGASQIFKTDFISSVDTMFPIHEKQKVYNRPVNATLLNRMLYMDWKFTLADNDLVKVSSACNLAGIRVHYPMLDDRLVTLSTQIPSTIKMKGGRELRSFYKQTLRGFLPAEIIDKKKHGFGLPFGVWLKKSPVLQEHIYDNLLSLKAREYIEPTFIDNIIEIHRTDKAAGYYGTMVWILAVLQEWLVSRQI